MKVEIIPSPGGEDVMLTIRESALNIGPRLIFTRPELHELDWAIRKYLEEQPFRVLKGATGDANKK